MNTTQRRKSDRNRLIKKFWEDALLDAYKHVPGRKQRGRGIYVLYSKGRSTTSASQKEVCVDD
jgi:hypothetical protein